MKRGDLVEYTGAGIDVEVVGLYKLTVESGAIGHVMEPDPLSVAFGNPPRTIVNLHPVCYAFLNSQLRPAT